MNNGTLRILCIALPLLIASHAAVAVEVEGDSGKDERQAIGTHTTQWLNMQREGRAAGNLLTTPAAEAGPAYKRYIDSFSIPIPEQLSESAYGTRR